MKGHRIAYTPEQMDWLEANRAMVISNYHAAFVAAFNRAEVTAAQLHGLRKRKGWKVGRAPGRMVGRNRRYSDAEITWLRDNAALPIGEYHAGFQMEFDRPAVTPDRLQSLRKRLGWKTGRTGRFEKGRASPNKGKPCPPGVGGRHPNARATQFKKGARSGRAQALHQPIGTERLHADGYLERKVNKDLPMQARWRFVHLIRWEAVNGPIPEGHCLKSVDGDRSNTDPTNWTAIPRGVLPRLNGGRATRHIPYDTAAPALKPTLLALARVEHQARQLRRGQPSEAGQITPKETSR